MPFRLFRKWFPSLNSGTYLTLHNDLATFYLLYQKLPFLLPEASSLRPKAALFKLGFILSHLHATSFNFLQVFSNKDLRVPLPQGLLSLQSLKLPEERALIVELQAARPTFYRKKKPTVSPNSIKLLPCNLFKIMNL